MKIILSIAAILLLAAPGQAEILNCTLDQYELHDPNAARVRFETIKSTEGKEMTISVVIAGLDSAKVTAKGGLYAISVEEQIYPMSQGWGLSGRESEWYYVKSNQGILVFELSAKTRRRDTLRAVVIHEHATIPDYTMVGYCK